MLKNTRRARRAWILGWTLGLAACLATAGHAESLDLEEMASALALPIITGGFPGNVIKGTSGDVLSPSPDAVTLVTVTNGSMAPIVLKLDAVSGDPVLTGAGQGFDNDRWQSTSFDCPLTGRETVTFLFTFGTTTNSTVFAECAGLPIARPLNVANGILFVGVADAVTGELVSRDVIIGEALVVDTLLGGAFCIGGFGFQAGAGSNDGDKTYEFDGLEYAELPDAIATNFIAPTTNLNAELILFTLDGTVGQQPTPRVRVTGLGYNDDEVPFDFQYEFDCFDIVSLPEIDPNFIGGFPGLGSFVGHLQLRTQPIGRAGFDAHDAQFGDGNNIRNPGVLGWIAQGLVSDSLVPAADGTVLPPGGLFPGSPGVVGVGTFWGRPMAMSRRPMRPFLRDRPPVFNAAF